MLGAIFGDITGSIYEFDNVRNTDEVKLFDQRGYFTDDTVMTLCVAKGLMSADLKDEEVIKVSLINSMVEVGRKYPDCGYGNLFYHWIFSEEHEGYHSFGNGSAMRVSAVPYLAKSLSDCLRLAELSAVVSHDHPEGIKGAVAVAGAIYLAKEGADKEAIRSFVEGYYSLDEEMDSTIRSSGFDETCQGSVPKAIVIFLESDSFYDCIAKAIASGGDSDTIGAIAGSIAEAYYGIPQEVESFVWSKLDKRLKKILKDFNEYISKEVRS